MKKLCYILGSLLFATSPVFASVSDLFPQSMTDMMSDGVIYHGGIIRAVVSLFIVIGLIYLTAWAYKKLNVLNEKTLVEKTKKLDLNKFNVISTQTLGPNKNLHVVEINGKYLVIGSTPNNITLIKEFEKAQAQEIEKISPKQPQQQPEEIKQPSKPKSPADKQMQDILDKYKNL